MTPGRGWVPVYRLYYDSVHWITDITDGPDGKIWYILLDELLGVTYNVPANQLRPIPAEEIAPISPEVPFLNKRIEISLSRQHLTAFEYDMPVFDAEISSGIPSTDPGENGIPTITPTGKFNVNIKMPSKHMGEGNLAADVNDYVLPGCSLVLVLYSTGARDPRRVVARQLRCSDEPRVRKYAP